jgi:Flp pilus assembly protein TadD
LPGPADPWDFSAWGGKALLDTGGPPPVGTPIDMRCGTTITRVAFTRADGKFVYRELSPDADARSYSERNNSWANVPFNFPKAGTVRADQADCEVRAVLKGYTSTVAFPYRQRGWNRQPSEETTIFLYKKGSGVGAGPVSKAMPGDARKAFDRANAALVQGNHQEALRNFRKAAEICPACAEPWYELGRIEAKQGRVPQAREDFSRALGADPNYVLAYVELAALAAAEKDWVATARHSSAVIHIDPVGYPGVYIYQALAEYNMNHLESAEKSLREELKYDPEQRYPEASYMLGTLLAERGDYAAAIVPLRTYLERAPTGAYATRARQQLGELEKLAADRR